MALENFVVHEYFGIDYENIWQIISKAMPENIQDLEIIIKEEKKNDLS